MKHGIHFEFDRVWFKERFTINYIQMNTSNINNVKFKRFVSFKVIWFMSFRPFWPYSNTSVSASSNDIVIVYENGVLKYLLLINWNHFIHISWFHIRFHIAQFLANHNNNTDFTYKHFSFYYLFFFYDLFFWVTVKLIKNKKLLHFTS